MERKRDRRKGYKDSGLCNRLRRRHNGSNIDDALSTVSPSGHNTHQQWLPYITMTSSSAINIVPIHQQIRTHTHRHCNIIYIYIQSWSCWVYKYIRFIRWFRRKTRDFGSLRVSQESKLALTGMCVANLPGVRGVPSLSQRLFIMDLFAYWNFCRFSY